ncbi:MAG: DinB family protein [Bacteroidota bacterium]
MFEHIIQACTATLSQTHFYLEKLDPEQYADKLTIFSGSSIGQHTRHVIEFYQCLLHQLPQGVINYDKRIREKKIETDPTFTSEVVDGLLVELRSLSPDQNLILETRLTAEEDSYSLVPTSLERELIYNLEHTIHHMAVVRIGLLYLQPQLEIPADFGFAPSTINYQMKQ